jgi:hypothetical protein
LFRLIVKTVLIAAIVLVTLYDPAILNAGGIGLTEGVSSTVLPDRRSGRLVRRVVVSDRVIQAKLIAPVVPGSPAAAAPAQSNGKISELVAETAARYSIDPLLVHAMIHVESGYNRFALSPKGAQGLMQLMPYTARRLGVRNSFDITQNIEGGVKYLRELSDRFDDLRHVLAAYNAGEEAVSRYKGIPPYLETREYVYKVGKRYGQLRRAQPQAVAVAVAKDRGNEPEVRSVEASVDSEGRLTLRTR